MDRTAFADCALMLATLSLAAGCGAKPSPPPRDTAPLVLAELQAVSPGPWRHLGREPIEVTSLDRTNASYPPPAELRAADLDRLEQHRDPIASPSEDNAGRESAPSRLSEPPNPGPDTGLLPAQPARELPLRGTPGEAVPLSQPGAANAIGQRRTLVEYRAPSAVPPTPAASKTADERGTMPWALTRRRSTEMDSTLKAAGEHAHNGFRLAERNALYLARAEFIAALELVAEANDVQQNSQFYTDALNAGLLALAESADFVQRRPVGQRLDIARIVSGHKTPILKNPPHNRLAPTLAAQRYCAYAQEQLAAAAAMEADASMALFGLGKVAIAQGTVSPARRLESTAQATALYQAALMADSRNFRASNELGVIEARKGDLVRARDLLVHSVRLAPHPATHRNLAAVYGKLGQSQLAEQAKSQATGMEGAGFRRAGPAVQWLDPAAFASTAPASDSLLPPAAGPTTLPGTETPPQKEEKAVTTAKRGLTDWLPWNLRR
jgi:hypothetical protein